MVADIAAELLVVASRLELSQLRSFVHCVESSHAQLKAHFSALFNAKRVLNFVLELSTFLFNVLVLCGTFSFVKSVENP